MSGAPSRSITTYDRFTHDYTREDLAELVPQLRTMERRVEVLQVVFNNNYEDQGQLKGQALLKLLDVG